MRQETIRRRALEENERGGDKVIECAIEAVATHIVGGDRQHLLPMRSYQGIQIVSAADFLALVFEQVEQQDK